MKNIFLSKFIEECFVIQEGLVVQIVGRFPLFLYKN